MKRIALVYSVFMCFYHVGSKASSVAAPFAIYKDEPEEKNDLLCDNVSSRKPSSMIPFPIFCDDSKIESAKADPPTVPSGRKSKKPVPIPIVSGDENSQQPKSCRKNKAKASVLTCRPPETTTKPPTLIDGKDEEDKENVAPAGGSSSAHKISTTGILKPTQGVLYASLELQEKVLDEDEREQEIALGIENQDKELGPADIVPQPSNQPNLNQTANPNQTMFIPSPEDFEEMARMASTPFNGRRCFVPDEDENTCAIQIAFKKPLPVQTEEMQEPSKEVPLPQIEVTSVDENAPSPINDESLQLTNSMRKTLDRLNRELQPQQKAKQEEDTDDSNAENVFTSEDNYIAPQPQAPINVMSPIMETSREYYRTSSSSSSSHSQWHITSNKSHWTNGNNTTAGPQHRSTNNIAISGVSIFQNL